VWAVGGRVMMALAGGNEQAQRTGGITNNLYLGINT
jgi:hypothetical protein